MFLQFTSHHDLNEGCLGIQFTTFITIVADLLLVLCMNCLFKWLIFPMQLYGILIKTYMKICTSFYALYPFFTMNKYNQQLYKVIQLENDLERYTHSLRSKTTYSCLVPPVSTQSTRNTSNLTVPGADTINTHITSHPGKVQIWITQAHSLPWSSIDTWNGLKEEVIMAMTVH